MSPPLRWFEFVDTMKSLASRRTTLATPSVAGTPVRRCSATSAFTMDSISSAPDLRLSYDRSPSARLHAGDSVAAGPWNSEERSTVAAVMVMSGK